jgi:hypothetical protein
VIVRIIAMTAHSEAEARGQCRRGEDDFVSKRGISRYWKPVAALPQTGGQTGSTLMASVDLKRPSFGHESSSSVGGDEELLRELYGVFLRSAEAPRSAAFSWNRTTTKACGDCQR